MDHFAASDVDTGKMDGPKALDPNRPIREADVIMISDDFRY
jgi:hypothetical protein